MTPWEIRKLVKSTIRNEIGRLHGLVRRGILGAVTPGPGVAAQIKSTYADVDDDVEVFQQYGFYSIPNGGAECILLRAGGAREHTIAILPGDRTTSPAGVAPGEVAVYHPSGSQIVMRTDGSIEITPAPGLVAKLGGPAAVLAVARATDPVSTPSLAVLQAAIAGWTPVAADGGAALKTALTAWLADANVANGTITAGGIGATST